MSTGHIPTKYSPNPNRLDPPKKWHRVAEGHYVRRTGLNRRLDVNCFYHARSTRWVADDVVEGRAGAETRTEIGSWPTLRATKAALTDWSA
jgi:hypothetical protein